MPTGAKKLAAPQKNKTPPAAPGRGRPGLYKNSPLTPTVTSTFPEPLGKYTGVVAQFCVTAQVKGEGLIGVRRDGFCHQAHR